MNYLHWQERRQRLGIGNKRHWYAVRRSVAETEKLRLAALGQDIRARCDNSELRVCLIAE